MIKLSGLKNTNLIRKNVQRVGRGPSSGRGKTSCRGQKGAGSRSGYKRRFGYEGGQKRLFTKLPTRGFTRGRFVKPSFAINLDAIDQYFGEGEVVNAKTLYDKKLCSERLSGGVKILGKGALTKKVTIEANRFSKEAIKKLDEAKITYKVLS